MLTDHRCTKYTDCSSCSFYQRDIFKYRLYPKGYVIPQTRCMQNMVFFLVKGEIWLNSEEHPDTTFRGGQFVLQPIGSKVECKVLDYTECIIYLFERPQNICDKVQVQVPIAPLDGPLQYGAVTHGAAQHFQRV